MAISYVGIVTRSEKDTGATIMAKVVTPNKLKATTKEYKITVAANELSDYDKATADCTYVKNMIQNGLGDLTSVTRSISSVVPQSAPNGSTINVTLTSNPNGTPLENCFTGLDFIKRPGIGDKDASGTIDVTTVYNEEERTVKIPITVPAESAQVFVDAHVNFDNIWDGFIRGNNDKNSGLTKGYSLITDSLNTGTEGVLIVQGSQLTAEQKTLFPGLSDNSYLRIQTTVTDSLPDGLSTLYGNNARISAVGAIDKTLMPTYSACYTKLQSLSSGSELIPYLVQQGNRDSGYRKNYYKIKGVTITCKVKFVDENGTAILGFPEEKTVRSSDAGVDVCTRSKYLTNAEIIDEIFNNNNFNASILPSSSSSVALGSKKFSKNEGTPQSVEISEDYASPVISFVQSSGDNDPIGYAFGEDGLMFDATIKSVTIGSDVFTENSVLEGTAFSRLFDSAVFSGSSAAFQNIGSKWIASMIRSEALDKTVKICISITSRVYVADGTTGLTSSTGASSDAWVAFTFTDVSGT